MTPAARASVPCTGCGSTYSVESWRTLARVRTLGEADLRPHVVAWPTGKGVEVRSCGKCGRGIARLAPAG